MGESLKVTTAYDGSAIEAGLRKTGEYAGKFGDSIKGKIFGAFTAGAIAGKLIGVFSGVFDKVKELSEQKQVFGMSVESIQVLQKAAARAGLEIDDLTMALNSLTKMRAAAIGGDQAAIEKLQHYGLSLKDINDETTDSIELIKKMGAAMSRQGNGAVARAGRMEDFGRGANKFAATAEILGNSNARPNLSEEDVAKIEEARRAGTGVGRGIKGFFTQIIGEMFNPSVHPFITADEMQSHKRLPPEITRDVEFAKQLAAPKLNLSGAADSSFRVNSLQAQGAFVGARIKENNTAQRQLQALERIDKNIEAQKKLAADRLRGSINANTDDWGGVQWP